MTEAIAAAEQAQAIEHEVYGAAHEQMLETLKLLADLHETAGDQAGMVVRREQMLAVNEKLHGPTHWRANEARCDLARLRKCLALLPAERQELDQLMQQVKPNRDLYRSKSVKQALEMQQRIVDTYQRYLGKADPQYAKLLNDLGSMYRGLGELEQAEELCTAAHAIAVEQLGPDHPDAAPFSLGLLKLARGNYQQALADFAESARIRRDSLGDKCHLYAQALSLQAAVHVELGDYASAEPLLQINKTIEEQFEDSNLFFVNSLFELGDFYHRMGDFAQAKPLYQRAAGMYRDLRGETPEKYLEVLDRLGELELQLGEPESADETLSEGLRIVERRSGPASPSCVRFLQKLARARKQQGEKAAAGALLARAEQIMSDSGDAVRLNSAAILIDLAELADDQQQFERAEELYNRAVADTSRIRGEQHPDVAQCLDCLAKYLVRRGRAAEAEPLFRQALRILRRQMDRTALVQSERQQLAMSRQYRAGLDSYVVLATAHPQYVEAAYREVYRWKGAVFCRRRLARRSSDDPQVKTKWVELTKVTNELAALSLNPPEPERFEAWNRRLRDLTMRQERLEVDLVQAQGEIERDESDDADPLVALRAKLPEDVALVDLLEIAGAMAPSFGERSNASRLVAFVVRRTEPIALVDLGSAAEIGGAIEQWREAIELDGADASTPGRKVGRLVWRPLAQHVSGTDHILISPDGVACRLPWAALPGETLGSYLIEQLGVAVVPVPQLLPELLASADTGVSSQRLLAVGDIDFDNVDLAIQEGAQPEPLLADGRRSPLRAGAIEKLPALSASGPEIAAVIEALPPSAPAPFELRGAAASESRFRKLAAECRWIHLATHGFFAPAELVSALRPRDVAVALYNQDFIGAPSVVGWDPNLLSGVALAGANVRQDATADDGILTAAEVAAIDLTGCELVTLSACETGLGAVAGGEGVLGLQRAFQIAGARTTVTSLWNVHDDATRALMTEFYANLWQRQLGKLKSLREAQLKMLRGDFPQVAALRAPGQRVQVDRRKRDAARQPLPPGGLPPRYWAAFVLAGDWR